jgi:hypothetical protein
MMRVGELFGDNLSTIAGYTQQSDIEEQLAGGWPLPCPHYGTLLLQLQSVPNK